MKKLKLGLLMTVIFSAMFLLGACNEPEAPEVHTHTFGEWQVLNPATCSAEGLKGRDCLECPEYERETIAKIDHVYEESKVIAVATCTSNGSKLLVCKHCKDVTTEGIPSVDHTMENGVCKVCNYQEELKNYSLVMNANGGTITDISGSYQEGTSVSLANPTKEGYIFGGWYTTSNFTAESKLTNVLTINSDVSIYAKWLLDGYVITLNAGIGKVDYQEVIVKEYEIFTLEVPTTKEYKFFTGWYLGLEQITDKEGQCLKPWNVLDNVELTAGWADSYKDGDITYLYQGEYPQSVVTVPEVIAELEQITNVNSRGYLEYDGNQYAKVVYKEKTSVAYFNNGEKLTNAQTYYFLVEPILWRVLDSEKNIVITDLIVDAMGYYENDKFHESGVLLKPNNYEYSDINSWLNGDVKFVKDNFASKAFVDPIKSLVMSENIDNSASSTKDDNNPYASNNLKTFLYLLSYQEYKYTFNKILNTTAKVTDYAVAKNVFADNYSMNGEWWLRSPESSHEALALTVTTTGSVNMRTVNNQEIGIRPVVVLKNLGGAANE